jgi:hypothetical protein
MKPEVGWASEVLYIVCVRMRSMHLHCVKSGVLVNGRASAIKVHSACFHSHGRRFRRCLQ